MFPISKIKAILKLLDIRKRFLNGYPRKQGAEIFHRLFRSPESAILGSRIRVELPHDEREVIARGGTTDAAVYQEVVLGRELEIPVKIQPRFIIDGGAYVGYSSIFFSKEYPDAKVLSVEANADNFAVLQENVSRFPQVSAIHAAIYTEEGTITMEDPVNEAWAHRVKSGKEAAPDGGRLTSAEVRATTIQRLLEESGEPRIDLIKLDIEGVEYDLFQSGNLGWLERTGAVLIECHDKFRPGCSALVKTELESRGFRSVQARQRTNLFYYKPLS